MTNMWAVSFCYLINSELTRSLIEKPRDFERGNYEHCRSYLPLRKDGRKYLPDQVLHTLGHDECHFSAASAHK